MWDRARALWVIVLLCAALSPAWADSKGAKAAATAYAEGQKRYAAGDYVGAAQRFQAAHALDPDPAYLFNTAQAFRFAKQCTQAADYYRRFLAEVPNPPNRAKVAGYLAEMEACAKAAAVPTVTTELVAPTPPKAQAADPGPDALMPSEPTPVEQRDGNPGGTQRKIGIGLGVLGLVGVASGVYFALESRDYQDQTAALYDEARVSAGSRWTPDFERRERGLLQRGADAKRTAIVATSVGGALIVTGVIVYVLGRRGVEEPRVSVVPTQGGAMATGAFRF